MIKLSKQEKKEEIGRLENRSLFYLKFFTSFWFAIIFFIFREIMTNKDALNISVNFMTNIFKYTTFQGALASMGFFILFLLIPATIISLIAITIHGILSYKGTRKPLDKLLEEKYENLMNSVRSGLFASIILVLYLIYLFFIDNESFSYSLQKIRYSNS